jgi:hypothetical protein
MYAKQEPFKVTEHELKEYVVDSDLRPQMPEDVPKPIAQLIRSCWQKNPALRPVAAEIVRVCHSLAA